MYDEMYVSIEKNNCRYFSGPLETYINTYIFINRISNGFFIFIRKEIGIITFAKVARFSSIRFEKISL